ncbi:hypothetical protein DFO45_2689 [Azorhizobium sp. AG788]|uniref:hypothetical protein n=1 Tax=Azorhizobium sp. AG788 TaxID=2183897 RepID=UPI00105F0A34|nr:hypothetical protein [Azorhizobium sp. AG788]TDT94931.1 hypothetical protein DFO45_2689 [Azorhizobium sp. AG788]
MARALANPVPTSAPRQGVDGRTTLAKARAPLVTDGRIGDFFIDTVAKKLYGPKGAGGWPDNGLIKGDRGWLPVLAAKNDGARRVHQVVDWAGGEGAKPATGSYVGATGLVSAIGDAVDVRGPQGPEMLISSLTAASGAASYDTLLPVAEEGGDNRQRAVQGIVGAGGHLPFKTVSDAAAADLLPTVKVVTILDATDADGGPGHIRVRVDAEPVDGPKHRSADRYLSTGVTDSANGGWWALDTKSIAAGSLVPVPVDADAGKELIAVGLRAYISVPPRRIKLTEFGATGEVNPTVDTAAWAAALARIDADGAGKIIELPTCKPGPTGGTYLGSSLQLTNAARNKTSIVGSGFAGPQSSTYSGGSRVVTNISSGFPIVLGSSLAPYTHFSLHEFTIDNQGSPASGANILVNNAAQVDIYVEHWRGYHGVQIENAGGQAICRLNASTYYYLTGRSMVFGLAQPYFANGVYVDGGGSYSCQSAALFMRASGVYISKHESYQATDVAWDFSATGIGVQGVWLTDVLADSGASHGYIFRGTGPMAEINMTAAQAGSNNGAGIATEASTLLNGLYVNGGLFVNNLLDLDLYGGKNLNVKGLQAWYAATATARLNPTMTGGVVIEGCQMGHGGWFQAGGLPSRTPYCALIATGADNYFVTGNTMRGATVSAVADGNAASATRVSTGNRIY